ncbi:hypothetical protein MNEG_0865 [Monoraphidium neglectum]|uniref:Uncharacterized protein n=1 Tax=Monoraphidium neglectum TaxID=145388 RepID=A0A0D2NS19_9CHLO|nr:hypothetical protein MNEG_0865 [Monoraphidium neglectum]KIZ07076.1 hypothetical protein MNEG_0865 [Monoraphidium neglectum]|eukprot:XP_013906095.1 hypothetical protein MNEG_0865 [Monoraphidium neglectum]
MLRFDVVQLAFKQRICAWSAVAWRAGEQEVGVLREQQLELSEDEKQEQEQQQQEEQLHHQAEEQEVRQQAASGGGSPQGEAGGGGDGASGQPGWRALLSGGAMASGGAAPWSLTGAAEFAAVSVAFAAGAKMLYNYYSGGAPEKTFSYVPFSDRYDDESEVVAVDCTHPRLPTLSHQRGSRNPGGGGGLRRSDTSTGLVLNALATGPWKRDVWAVCQRSFVTTNHFDVDSFLAVWCYINRAEAVAHEGGELGGPVGRMAV